MTGPRVVCLILLLLGAGCGSSRNPKSSDSDSTAPSLSSTHEVPQTNIRYQDVTARTGVNLVVENGQERGLYSILETLGTGVALADFDSDGNLDLIASEGGTYTTTRQPIGLPLRLFRNLGAWHFEEVSQAAILHPPELYTHGLIVGDYNSDGFADLLLTGYRGLRLYENQGDGTFSEVSDQAKLSSSAWNTAAAWGDLNGDGHLDLFVVRYLDWSVENQPNCAISETKKEVCGPGEFAAVSDRIFFSNGDGTFREAEETQGLVPGGKGLGLVLGDVDGDRDLDAYVANDTTPNFLYLNDGEGVFQESGIGSGTAVGERGDSDGSMGVDLGDYNNDGLPDLWVANYEDQLFALYKNQGNALFEHSSTRVGIARVGSLYVGFGTAFLDADGDGDEDIVATNGHVMRHPRNAPILQTPLLFENRGDAGFTNVAPRVGEYFTEPHMGRGLAVGDMDLDGDLDLIISQIHDPLALLENQSLTQSRFFAVRLIGTKSSRDPIGAAVTLHTDKGRQHRHVKGGGSFLSSSSPQLTFAVPPGETIEKLTVQWPSSRASTVLKNRNWGDSMTIIESGLVVQ